MKVSVLGGSTPHTVALVEAILEVWTAQHGPMAIHLIGRNVERLNAVTSFSNKRIAACGAADFLQVFSKTDPALGCENADVVIFQVRAGGLEGRAKDETFSHAFQIPGDEGLGPGGLAAAMRTFPVMEQLAKALPPPQDCMVLMLTNPLGLCCRKLQELWPGHVLGVCELPQLTLDNALGHAPNEGTRAEFSGMNHQAFWHRIEQDGVDLLPKLIAELPSWARDSQLQGALPLPYLRLYFDREALCAEHAARPNTRSVDLMNLCDRLIEECQRLDGSTPLSSGADRSTPWYDRVVVRALAAKATGRKTSLFATMPAGMKHSFASEHSMIEREVLVGEEVTPLADPPCPEGLQPFLRRISEAEDLAWIAANDPNVDAVFQAMRAHPLCDHLNDESCKELARACLQAGGQSCE